MNKIKAKKMNAPLKNHNIKSLLEELSNIVKKCGYSKHADEQLIDGITGEMIPGKMFMGLAYYQRLKHMVSNFFIKFCISNNLTQTLSLCRWRIRSTPAPRRGREV